MAEFDLWIVEHGHLLNGSTADWGRTHMWHGECFPKTEGEPTEGRDVRVGEEGEQRPQEGAEEGQEEEGGEAEQQQEQATEGEHTAGDASAQEGEHETPR